MKIDAHMSNGETLNVSGFFSPVFTHLTSSFFRMTNGVKVLPLKERERESEIEKEVCPI